MTRIKSLTDAQKARFGEFVTKWTEIGLSTQPANRAEAERGIITAYKIGGRPHAPKIVWCGSPFSNALTRALVLNLIKESSLSVRDSVWASVRDSGYGQNDSDWLAFYDYFREVCGLTQQTEPLSGLVLIAKSSGWWLPHENICWASERPATLHLDERNRLHSADGPAIRYPDGWSIYAWHGVRLPAAIIEQPDTITVNAIDAEANAEIRRVMVEKYGQSRYLLDGNAQLISKDDYGTLYRREMPGDEPLVMVKVINSTPEPDGSGFKDYFLRVPPTVQTAHEAVAWTWNMSDFDYQPVQQS